MTKEEDIKDYLALNGIKWVNKLASCVNKMDGRCRQMLMSKPNRPMTDYCAKCQAMLKQTMESALK